MSAKQAVDTPYVRRTRGMALRASVTAAYLRNTGITSKAAHRLFTTALDYAGGLQQFQATFAQIGRRMLGQTKTDDAYVAAVSRDVKTHREECAESRYPGLEVTSGFKKQNKRGDVEYEVARWDFKALPYLVKMLELAARLEKENRQLPYERRLKREQLFDEAFRLAEVPRAEIVTDDEPPSPSSPDPEPDDDDFNMAYRRCVAYARGARLKLIEKGAPDEVQAATLDLLKADLERVFSLSPEQLKQKLTSNGFDTSYRQPVGEEAVTSVANEPFKGPASDEHVAYENDGSNSGFVGENDQFSENMGTNLEQSKSALAALSSVGVETVNVLFCNDVEQERLKAEYGMLKAKGLKRKEILELGIDPQDAVTVDETAIPITRLRSLLGDKMAECAERKWSFIIDPRSIGDRLIMADECDEAALDLLQDLATYAIETSDGNGQAILVLPETFSTKAQCDEVKERLFLALKPMGCNKGSSGASRWPGSFNFKTKRQRADGSFPQVKLRACNPGRMVTPEELKDLGLLPELPKPKPAVTRSTRARIPTAWPEYDHALASADRSRADWKFAREAKLMGWPQAHVEEELSAISDKAQERSRRNGRYVTQTVGKAFDKPHDSKRGYSVRETGVI